MIPLSLTQAVDLTIAELLRDHAKYDHRSPFDEADCYALHALAERVYAQGWKDGCDVQVSRSQQRSDRQAAREA